MSKIFEALQQVQMESARNKAQREAPTMVEAPQARTVVAQVNVTPSCRPQPAVSCGPDVTHPAAQLPPKERRQHKRSKRKLQLLVRPSDPEQSEHFEEVLATCDASRGGLSVTMGRETYREGMRLFITYPYMPSAPHLQSEYLAQIVRIEASGGCAQKTMAVQLLGSMNIAIV